MSFPSNSAKTQDCVECGAKAFSTNHVHVHGRVAHSIRDDEEAQEQPLRQEERNSDFERSTVWRKRCRCRVIGKESTNASCRTSSKQLVGVTCDS